MVKFKTFTKKNKMNATKVRIDNITFASKLESEYYIHLKILKRLGEITHFHTQVPIRLPGGKKYVCDFLVFYRDGYYEYIDVKGYETELFKLKQAVVEHNYPFQIKIIKKGDF